MQKRRKILGQMELPPLPPISSVFPSYVTNYFFTELKGEKNYYGNHAMSIHT